MDYRCTFSSLSHRERSRRCQLICDANLCNAQGKTEKIRLTAQILKAGYPCHSNGNPNGPIAPGASMGIDDEDACLLTCSGFDLLADHLGRMIRFQGEEQYPLFSCIPCASNIGVIDACVCAYEAKFVFNNNCPGPCPQYFIAFLKD